MWHRSLAETIVDVNDWLAKRKRNSRILATILLVVLASIGFYFLGFPGAFLGILLGVGMMDEIFGKKPEKNRLKSQVFCPQCGYQQDWAEDKLCERCRSHLRK